MTKEPLTRSTLPDSDLLDWLDAQGAYYGWAVQLPEDYPHVRNCVFLQRNSSEGHPTVRSAILAAIEKQKTRKTP